MKKLSLVATMFLITFLASAQTKVGTIDVDFIINQMPGNADVNKGLEDYNSELQEDMQKTIQNYKDEVKNYQDSSAVYTEDQKKKKESAIVGMENDIKGFRQKASVMMQMKRNELSKPLYQKIDAAMQKVVQREGYTQILQANSNNLAYSDARYDITDLVIKELGITVKENKTPQSN